MTNQKTDAGDADQQHGTQSEEGTWTNAKWRWKEKEKQERKT